MQNRATNKPPKIRFRPGEWFKINGQPYIIVYAFRLVSQPGVWQYVLEDAPYRGQHPTLTSHRQALDRLLCVAAKADPQYRPPTERIIYNPVHSSGDASQHFRNIPCLGTCRIVRNVQQLLAAPQLQD